VPARIGPTATPHDVIRLELTDADGRPSIRHCLQSTHLGTIPSANFRLTRRKGLFNTFYRLWYAGALALVSAWEVFTFPGFQAKITVDGETWEGSFSGISLLKRGHVAGSFFFKTDRTPDDGRFDLGACNKVSPWKLISLVGQYEAKGLDLPPDMRFRVTTSATAEFSHPQPLDFDGELALVRKVKWTLLPRALPVFS
jgi:diacylglycerol kinase family enzyme